MPQTQTVLEGLLEPGPAHAQTKTKEFSEEFGLSRSQAAHQLSQCTRRPSDSAET